MPQAGSWWEPRVLLDEAQANLKVDSHCQLGVRADPRAWAFAYAAEFLGFPRLLCFHSCAMLPSPSLQLPWLEGAPVALSGEQSSCCCLAVPRSLVTYWL